MTESAFRRLLLRFALTPIICLCAFLCVLGYKVHEITVTRSEAREATSVLLQSGRLLQSMMDEETGIRGYLAAKDPLFLQPYYEASQRFGSELASLTSVTADLPGLPVKVAAVANSFKDFDAINQALLKSDLTAESTVALLKRQKQAMDTLRGEFGGLMSQETVIRESRRSEIDTLYGALPALGIGGAAGVALLLIWHGIYVFQEITRAFRQQINQSEIQRDSLHTTLQSIGDAVIVCDSSGRITLMNPTAEEVTGWRKAQAVGEPLNGVFRIVNEYDRRSVESPVDKVLRAGQVVGLANHTLLIRQDGSEISIDDSGAPIRDRNEQIVGVVLVFRDIEARRKAERELELRTAELESMLFHSTAAFASFDSSHRYMRVNRATAQVNGVAEEDHLGKSLRDIVHENAAALETIIDEVFASRTAIQLEVVRETEGEPGVARQWLTCFYPVMTEHRDHPVLVGSIALETTDRWRAQESLLRSEKLAAVGRLAASIAHEMNNPLASVTNLLYLIARDERIEGQTREFVERANIELARASNIARQTLRFAKRSTAAAQVDLNEVATSILLLFSGRISQNKILAQKKVRGVPRYFGHANELMQLLTNLVGNSLDALSPHGQLVVAIQQTKDWKTEREGISITVADSGSGIPEKYRSKVWEPFFTTKAETGTGLGLWLVEEMVRKNGGNIRLRTSTHWSHHGAIFRIFLPSRGE